MPTHRSMWSGEPDVSRRRFLTYVVAAPVLTVAVKAIDDMAGPFFPSTGAASGVASPALSSPGVSTIVDLTDALTLAALPTAYLLTITITEQNRVVVHVPRAEVGQGITTAMGIVAAEELDAGLETVDVVLDDARPELLWNQLTGGSNSVHALYTPMRTVAAAARAQLVTAAAQRFGVDASTLTTRDSVVFAPDGRTATYGSLSAEAARVAAPAVPGTPKDPSQFTLIGQPTTRLDARDIVTGKAKYALDLPVAAAPTVVARPPTIGGSVRPPSTTRPRAECPGCWVSPRSRAASRSPPRPSIRPRPRGTRYGSHGIRDRTPRSRMRRSARSSAPRHLRSPCRRSAASPYRASSISPSRRMLRSKC